MNDRYPMRVIPGYCNSKPGIQVGTKLQGQVSYENGKLEFIVLLFDISSNTVLAFQLAKPSSSI